MRQVSQEEYGILTRFHPGEVRYYVDIDKATSRTKGEKVVKTTRKTKVPVAADGSTTNVTAKAVTKKTVPAIFSRRGYSQHVQLTTKDAGSMRPESILCKVYTSCVSIFNADPTVVLTRKALTEKLLAANPSMTKLSQIVPSISGLIAKGNLRYTGTSVKV